MAQPISYLTLSDAVIAVLAENARTGWTIAPDPGNPKSKGSKQAPFAWPIPADNRVPVQFARAQSGVGVRLVFPDNGPVYMAGTALRPRDPASAKGAVDLI